MHKKNILIILVLTIFTFGNSLLNDFVGDDNVLFRYNSFYDSWGNFPAVFTRQYITNTSDEGLSFQHKKNFWSGSVAYRPVLSTTFFLDHSLWNLNPFGYHLTSLIVHILNAILVYFLVFILIQQLPVALLSALLFSLHPVKVEAVCSIGYRGDILATLFVLLSTLTYIKFQNSQRKPFWILSLASFFLAVFTKESAVILPFLLIAYDKYFGKGINYRRHFLYFAILFFYLYIYILVFPNLTLTTLNLLGGSLLNHTIVSFQIFFEYIMYLIFPFAVNVLPPLYAPPMDSLSVFKAITGFLMLIGFIYGVIKYYRTNKFLSYFLFWFLISLAPVSNIILTPNPMAYRFLYLPSVGFLVVAALLIEKFSVKVKRFDHVVRWGKILTFSVLFLCMFTTFLLNNLWKNDQTMARALVEYYPDNAQGYLFSGFANFRLKLYGEATRNFERSYELGLVDPRLFYSLGVCYSKTNPEKAISVFEEGIREYADYALLHLGLGRILLFQGQNEEALFYLEKSLELYSTYPGYAYVIQIYLMRGEIDKAAVIYGEAEKFIKDEGLLKSLKRMLESGQTEPWPVDVGI